MPYATSTSTSGSDAVVTLGADPSKNYVVDSVAYSYNSANPNLIGRLTVKIGDNIVFDVDVPDGGVSYFPAEFGADGYDIPIEVKLHGVGTGSSARIGKLSIKYRE